ncbi:hypothetical protein FACS189476_02040 [Spirochaetia bacterium]|nr:hypothetical protein FACS189476_02040 [Spirochaetia bacterium]
MVNMGKKRIGLLLASIHKGSAQNVWSSFAREAAAEGAVLFVFPGGELNSPSDLDYLRNPIFSLANPRSLDGLISWSSAIGNAISPEEFRAFHESFAPLPYVTIAHKVPGHPCVQFDAYQGMKNLTSHFIREHGARRIAFLRGPETHASAMDRLRGYRDAITEAGLVYDEALVTESSGWAEGEAACARLIEDRGLLPRRDFDTLIGSSDMMALPAIQYLSKLGYSTPGDYRAGGFNNSIESRILSPPLSTVHMPYAELSGESFKILKGLFETPQGGCPPDVILTCEVIIRESCGCPGERPAGESVAALVRALKEQEQAATHAQYQREKWHTALNSLKCELLGTRDRTSLIRSLAQHLPKIGIFTAAVMLHDEGDLSLCVGSFSPGGLNIKENRQFPADRLFPEEMEAQYTGGVFMVQPLFIENRSLGYFIHNVPFYDGVILEELRSTVSNAFKGIFLFEEADRAKQIAEQAERAKSEFFAALGNVLYDPFSELIDAIDAVKGGLAGGLSGGGPAALPADIQERLSGLRSLAEQQQERTNHLLDLSLSQIDEPSFKTGPFNITAMLEGLAGETATADAKLQNEKNLPILFIGIDGDLFPSWTDAGRRTHISSVADLAEAVSHAPPSLIVIGGIDGEAIKTIEAIRRHPGTAMTPLIAVPEIISEAGDVEKLCRCPRVVLCHRSVAKLGEFSGRVRAIAAGDSILPLYTGALVKRALLYFEKHAESHISRWKLADSVNVSEDYLTRIFRREMGCSLWEYLSQYRVCLASDLLIHTGDTISEIAARTGFQDQAYFCRVFKKIYGKAPGQLRSAKSMDGGARGIDSGTKKDGKVQ